MDEGKYTCSVGPHKCHQTYTEPGKSVEYCYDHLPEPETE